MTRVGIDVGGVIIDRVNNDGTDTSFFSENYLATTAVADAFRSIRGLVDVLGPGNVFIISKCGPQTQDRTIRWFRHQGFFTQTNFEPRNILFCRERAAKAPIARDLELTHFADDKLEVLEYMRGVVPYRLLFGPQGPRDSRRLMERACDVQHVLTWADVLTAVGNTHFRRV